MEYFIEELKEMKKYLLSWFFSFLIIVFTLFSVGLSKAEILDLDIYLPTLSQNSFSVMFFELVKNNLIPQDVSLIATSPSSAFITQALISIIGSFMICFPYLLYRIFQFLSPALYQKEKRRVLKILLPSGFLFSMGVLFAYLVLIPPTFRVLFSFNNTLGVIPYFSVSEFISWTLALMFMTGFMFLLPIFMYILSWLKIISSKLWWENWRIALSVFLVISAVITPDGSGVTMILLLIPMMLLYVFGAVASSKFEDDNKQ